MAKPSESKSVEGKISWATRISSGLRAVADKLDAHEVFNWWAHVLHRTGAPSEDLARVPKSEMRSGLRSTNPLVQLSSVFGLARIPARYIASSVDEVSGANPEWPTNLAPVNWLRKLTTGSTLYPDRMMLKSI